MIVRHVGRFESNLPRDLIEDENGFFVQPPGKSVAEAAAEIFRKLGCDVYYGPGPVLDVTWELGVQKDGRNFGAWINLVDDYWFWFEQRSWIDKLLRRYSPTYLDLLRDLARELAADPRFSNIRWFLDNADGEEGPGATAPVEAGRAPRRRNRRG